MVVILLLAYCCELSSRQQHLLLELFAQNHVLREAKGCQAGRGISRKRSAVSAGQQASLKHCLARGLNDTSCSISLSASSQLKTPNTTLLSAGDVLTVLFAPPSRSPSSI